MIPIARVRRTCVATLLLAALGPACSEGGAGGGGPAYQIGFSAPGATIDEDAGTTAIALVLEGPAQGSLAEAVSITIFDAGSGSATSGADYSAFSSQSVVFPAGSLAGAQQLVSFTALDDMLIEGPSETVVLGLSDAVGAGLGVLTSSTLSLLDSKQAIVRFTTSATSTANEASATYSALLQLFLPAGTSLATAVQVSVSDDSTGTASSGVDYTSVATTTVSFAAGSASLASVPVDISVLDDSTPEGNESVHLALSAPSPGVKLGAANTFQLTISDDDVASGAFLYASEGASGVENPMGPSSAVGLGTQNIGLGPNAGTLVRISNIGTTLFGLAAPILGGSDPQDFSIELESAPLPASLRPLDSTKAGFVLPTDVPAPVAAQLEEQDAGASFDLDVGLLGALDLQSAVTLHGFPLPARGNVTLALTRVPLPFSDDAKLLIDGVEQPGGPRALVSGLTLWSGTALELPASRVFLAFTPEGAQGFVELAGELDRIVHVVTERSATADLPARVRVAEEWQLARLGIEPPAELCAGAPLPPAATGAPGAHAAAFAGAVPPISELTLVNTRLAIETDYQLYQKFGNATALTNYVTALIAAVADRYVTDVQSTLSIAYLGVYTTAGDPWTSQDGGGNASALLDEFRAAWNSSGWPAAASLAHFISGANLGGGVAYVGVLCSSTFGYGVSGNINGNINWGAWNGQSASFTWDFVIVAHELGHNFGANHTHSYCPPLDQCYSNCSGTTACGTGTLMSYCHLCAGGMNNIRLQFHPVVANLMRSAINSSCLGYSILAAGDYVQYLVRFEPKSDPGLRTADLDFSHGAPNQPTPLRLLLSASAEN